MNSSSLSRAAGAGAGRIHSLAFVPWSSRRSGRTGRGTRHECACATASPKTFLRFQVKAKATASTQETGNGNGNGNGYNGKKKKVVVLGGTGRVGSATAAAIIRESRKAARESKGEREEKEESSIAPSASKASNALRGVDVVISGRRPEKVKEVRELWPDELRAVAYEQCDINDPESLDRVLDSADLVIHAAGPFQQTSSCSVLEAAIRNKVGYIDVCDDTEHTQRAKATLAKAAQESGIPAVVSCGVYPGLSNVMASYMCDAGSPFPENKPLKLRFSYFTAGSGGVGATILATSVLLLGEKVTQFVEGKRQQKEPYAERNVVEFGQKIGKREVFGLNLPEVLTAHEILGIPNVSAYFGTSPGIWNFMMQKMAQLLPVSLLQNRDFANGLAQVIMPLVVAVDKLVGKTTAMRIDVKYDNDKTSSSLFVHKDTAYTAGTSTAAFAAALLSGKVPAGVHFPEERCVIQDYEAFFRLASDETTIFAVAQAPWRLEKIQKRIILGLYW